MTNVTSWTDLAAISVDLTEDYTLTANLASGDADYSSAGGDDWTPLGSSASCFTGSLDGNGFTISDLIIDNLVVAHIGLFGKGNGCALTKIALLNINIAVGGSNTYTSSLIGEIIGTGSISECHSTGTMDAGNYSTGGIVGFLSGTAICEKSYSTVTITGGGSDCGGFVGYQNVGTEIKNCYATGNVTSTGAGVGGFAGFVRASITNCYATGNVISTGTRVSGFAGRNYDGTLTNCYSTGDSEGTDAANPTIGPFNGQNDDTITNCWYSAASSVTNNGAGGTNTLGTSTTNSSDFYVATQNVYDTTAPLWDFTDIWESHVAAYPTLRGEPPTRDFQAIIF